MTVAELRKHLEGLEGDRVVYLSFMDHEDVVAAVHVDVGEWRGVSYVVIGEESTEPCSHETRLI
jgi:hypothetical protein